MKYKNIKTNPNVSILIDNRDKNSDKKYLVTAVTVIGKASILEKFDRNIINKFIFYYPELTEFTKPKLNVLIKIDIDKFILVSELQKVVEVKP